MADTAEPINALPYILLLFIFDNLDKHNTWHWENVAYTDHFDAVQWSVVGALAVDVLFVRCNELGHFARDCPNSSGGGGPRGGGRGAMSDIRCYNCNEVGHMSRNCPTEA